MALEQSRLRPEFCYLGIGVADELGVSRVQSVHLRLKLEIVLCGLG